jgi:polysaccharide export outer membrane protein
MQKVYSYLLLFLLPALFSACVSPRQMAMFRSEETGTFTLPAVPEPVIRPYDSLNIRLSALDGEAITPYRDFGSVFVVNAEGDIVMPILGAVRLVDMTERQAAETIAAKLASGVKQPAVQVVNESLFVTILGEVRSPNRYRIRPALTLPDLIGLAGGLTPNGRRDDILLIRKDGNTVTQYRLSLSDNSLFASPYYWLQRDDVIIIAPRHSRKVNK